MYTHTHTHYKGGKIISLYPSTFLAEMVPFPCNKKTNRRKTSLITCIPPVYMEDIQENWGKSTEQAKVTPQILSSTNGRRKIKGIGEPSMGGHQVKHSKQRYC